MEGGDMATCSKGGGKLVAWLRRTAAGEDDGRTPQVKRRRQLSRAACVTQLALPAAELRLSRADAGPGEAAALQARADSGSGSAARAREGDGDLEGSGLDIREQVRQLPEATEADKVNVTCACMGLQLYLEGRYRKSSVTSYVGTIFHLFRRDGRSFATMAGTEYFQLVKGSLSNKKHHSIESSALKHFASFYAGRSSELGGEFKVDPKWGERLYNPGARALPVVAKARAEALGQAAAAPLARAASSAAGVAAVAGEDAEMVEVSGKVSIVDPISLCRIEKPVRGKNCEHLQAFDHQPYVEFNRMMERSRCRLSKLWNCPFCGKHVKEKDLVTANAFVSVLAAARDMPGVTHVESLPDGTLAVPSGEVPATANPGHRGKSDGIRCASDDEGRMGDGSSRSVKDSRQEVRAESGTPDGESSQSNSNEGSCHGKGLPEAKESALSTRLGGQGAERSTEPDRLGSTASVPLPVGVADVSTAVGSVSPSPPRCQVSEIERGGTISTRSFASSPPPGDNIRRFFSRDHPSPEASKLVLPTPRTGSSSASVSRQDKSQLASSLSTILDTEELINVGERATTASKDVRIQTLAVLSGTGFLQALDALSTLAFHQPRAIESDAAAGDA